MKYFIIAGEASGDLHGSQLIKALREGDDAAEFRFLGGDLMAAEAGNEPLVHYRNMAYMGFAAVVRHLGAILGNMKRTRAAIKEWNPDVLILIDYPSFNLKMAKMAHERGIKVVYFISPKVWVWKEWRVRDIKRYVDKMLLILPFEVDFYKGHGYEATYVGNPTMSELTAARAAMGDYATLAAEHGLDPGKPLLAILPGSRVHEIDKNLPIMLDAALRHPECQLAIAAAPALDDDVYRAVTEPLHASHVPLLRGLTWELLHHARAAIVTSGTATLEAAVLDAPQVACFRMNGKPWLYKIYRRLLKCKYVTLPNLIDDSEVIPELLVHHCTPDNIERHLSALLTDSAARRAQLAGYERVRAALGNHDCAHNAATVILNLLKS